MSLEMEAAGFILNPWGESFMLSKEMIQSIFQADGDVEYTVPEEPLTKELLADGTYLKRAVAIVLRNRTEMNMLRLMKILHESDVWVPCRAVFSDADYAEMEKIAMDLVDAAKQDKDDGEDPVYTTQDNVRLIPDILQNGEEFFFPVFTSPKEMGEYGEPFSQISAAFLSAVNLARNNERNVRGIVINAFTEPFLIERELFELIETVTV